MDGDGIINLAGGICWGDNVVFQSDSPESYSSIVSALIKQLSETDCDIYHLAYAREDHSVEVCPDSVFRVSIDPSAGFESFVKKCCAFLEELPADKDNVVVFDCLTSLMGFWGSDWISCYAYKIFSQVMRRKQITSFAGMLSSCHRKSALRLTSSISSVSIKVIKDNIGRDCLIPKKVEGNRSTVVYKPFILEEEGTRPISNSFEAVEISTHPGRESEAGHYDCLDRLFLGFSDDEVDEREAVLKLCRTMMGSDERILELASNYFTLDDLRVVQRRTVGSGFVGGKAAGMLIARKILKSKHSNKYKEFVEPDDSFYLGSDVFYAYIINNDMWDEYREYIDSPDVMKGKRLKRKIINGDMPEEVLERLGGIVEYFGHYPIIVRSSSLLEDGFESSFAGKYESHFCVLSGEDDVMIGHLCETIKCVFASMFENEVTRYRQNSDLHGRSDIMSVIVQRVSGVYQGDYYFPHLAGVGHSYNSYIWDRKIEPESGLLRLVAGLGTRAVGSYANDYARMVALNRPNDFPMPGAENRRIYAQKHLDVMNINTNSFDSVEISEIDFEKFTPSSGIIADRDIETERRIYKESGESVNSWYVDLDYVVNETAVLKSMGEIMETLERVYGHPVEIEFAINFRDKKNFRINILQCRPVQVQQVSDESYASLSSEYLVMEAGGTFLGGSTSMLIDTVVYIHWDEYVKLEPERKRRCAEMIGVLNERVKDKGLSCMLMGYGRWGSSVTALGVPVEFSQIDGMKSVVEIGRMERGLVAELSYGTHFFHDMVESKITYISVVDEPDNFFIDSNLLSRNSMLKKVFQDTDGFEKVISYLRFNKRPLRVTTDIKTKKMSVYRKASL